MIVLLSGFFAGEGSDGSLDPPGTWDGFNRIVVENEDGSWVCTDWGY